MGTAGVMSGSALTKSGVEAMKASRKAVFDFTNLPMDMSYPGMGNKTGTVFSAEILSNHDTGRMTFIYSVHLAGKYYTPDAEASIASTGKP